MGEGGGGNSKLKFKKGKYESELTVSVTCLEEGIC